MIAKCKRCEKQSLDIVTFMKSGCNACGNRLFVIVRNDRQRLNVTTPSNRETTDASQELFANISVKVQETGKFQINILALANRKSKNEPVFIEDENGKVNVIFSTVPGN